MKSIASGRLFWRITSASGDWENVAVTVNEPAQIAVLEGWFDIVAVDAPCSGEGMFRKTPEARDEWSESNVKICAVRQAEICAKRGRRCVPADC